MNSLRPTIEDLPVSPRAQELISEVASTGYRSQLRKFGRAPLLRELLQGGITQDEYDIVVGEREARRQILTAPTNQIPPEVPESPTTIPAEWSPTGILSKIPPRELDVRELAAGEHLDRKQ